MINKGLSYAGIGFLYLVSLLPFWLLYLVADLLYVILYRITGYRRKVVQQNLLNSFPEKSDNERKEIGRKYYSYLADLIIEIIKGITISQKQLEKRMIPLNFEILHEYIAQGKSVIGASGHYCNWEWTGQAFSLIAPAKTNLSIYKYMSNAIFDDFFIKVRSRFGTTMVEMKTTMRKMVSCKKEQFMAVLLADQTPVQSETQYFTTFLNQPTAVFLGVEKLAKLIDAPVVFCTINRVKRGYYTYTFEELTATPKLTANNEITEMHVRCLENIINKQPEYWLWSHRRWKFKPEDMN